MFAPQGHWRWNEIIELTYDWAKRIILAKVYEFEGKNPADVFEYSYIIEHTDPSLDNTKFVNIGVFPSPEQMLDAGLISDIKNAGLTRDVLEMWLIAHLPSFLCSQSCRTIPV